MRTSNPILSGNNFNVATWDHLAEAERRDRTMTVQGTVNAAFILLGLTGASALGTWMALERQVMAPALPMVGGGIAGLVIALVLAFSPRMAGFLAPLYAVLKGSCVAGLSFVVGAAMDAKLGTGAGASLIFQAILLTFGIFGGLLIAYTTGLIRLGSVAKRIIVAATLGVMIMYLATFVLSLMGVNIGFIHSSGPIGIGFSVVVVVLASLNLVLDFQFIEESASAGAPKHMEWYGAFGLLVTLIWLYIEILRLLMKLKDNR